MRNRVIITMQSGEKHVAAGYASKVIERVNAARGKGQLIAIERDVVPTGQMMHLDPDCVESVKDD